MFSKVLQTALVNLPRRKRRVLTACIDFLLLIAVVWLLISGRYGALYLPSSVLDSMLFAIGPFTTVVTLLLFRVYHGVARYIGPRGAWRMFALTCLSALIWSMVLFVGGQYGIPRSVVLVYPFIGTAVLLMFRFAAAAYLRQHGVNLLMTSRDHSHGSVPVVIIGTGELAVQLGRSLRARREYHLIGYVDSTQSMAGRWIDGVRIYNMDRLQLLIPDQGVKEIIVAMEQLSYAHRKLLMAELERFRVLVKVMPNIDQLTSGTQNLGLREVEGIDLLGREEVPTDDELIKAAVTGKSILVTGAGGSIGSQIARRALQLGVNKLVLLESSELALYKIEQELSDHLAESSQGPQLVLETVLGSVQDRALIDSIFSRHAIDTVFHAAAFKHVPIVERHPAVGISNNTFGTEIVARSAMDHCVPKFVLISTDKAVNPRSVLGASKRAAELIIKKLTKETTQTIFSAVRFGNVLGSSGSVIHRFKDQIRLGGPVTVTDRNVVRYFMSIDEAVNLVLQSAGIARGGEIFNLDMGSPVKIDSLARSMIRLMGLTERTAENPEGDIEIQYTGLRPGEKLVEDLCGPSDNICGTVHPRIVKLEEPTLDEEKFKRDLEGLRLAVRSRQDELIVNALSILVDSYNPSRDLLAPKHVRNLSQVLH